VSGMRRYFNDFNVTVATEGNIWFFEIFCELWSWRLSFLTGFELVCTFLHGCSSRLCWIWLKDEVIIDTSPRTTQNSVKVNNYHSNLHFTSNTKKAKNFFVTWHSIQLVSSQCLFKSWVRSEW
jgi:hypothetical protein